MSNAAGLIPRPPARYLERGQPGRYRVFDRHPATRGVDAEIVGYFIVGADGTVQWNPLLPA